MKQWLEAWAAYYRALYSVGLAALLMVVMAVAGAGLIGLVPYLLLSAAIGQWTALAVVGAVILPPLLGSFLLAMRFAAKPQRPPSWRLYKVGVPLPKQG